VQRVLQDPETAKRGNFDRVLVIMLQLKLNNFGHLESFPGLVNIPSMCHLHTGVLVVDVRFGRYKPRPTKKNNFQYEFCSVF